MHDLETRQLAWDCALVTGFRDGLKLKATFALFANYLQLQDGELSDALDGVKRVPSKQIAVVGFGTPYFVAQFLPRINDKLYNMVFGDKKRDLYDIILALNKSSVDTMEKPLQSHNNDQRKLSRDIRKQECTARAARDKIGTGNGQGHGWHIVKAVRPR